MQNNNNENRYGNLLNKYMDGGEKKSYSPMLNREISKRKDEGETRYGDLLKNAKPNNKIYDDILNVDRACRRLRQNEEEKEHQNLLGRQERIERKQRELQERKDRNGAVINNMLEKKRAEQAAIEKKKKLISIKGWRDWQILILIWQRYLSRRRQGIRIIGHIGCKSLVCPIFYFFISVLI